MSRVRALILNRYGGPDAIAVSSTDTRAAGPRQVVVRVHAAGVNGPDRKVREGHVRDAFPLRLPTVLGIELAGVVESVGAGVTGLRAGDRVMGPLGGPGAQADLVAVDEAISRASPTRWASCRPRRCPSRRWPRGRA